MVQAALTARFARPDGQVNLKLAYGGPLRDFNSVPFQLFPAVAAAVRATTGTVQGVGSARELRNVQDVAEFNGSAEAETEYPITEFLRVEVLGDAIDEEGRVFTLRPVLDRDTYRLKADRPCYAKVLVTYNTTYKQFYYVAPDPDGITSNLSQLAVFYDGGVQYLGKVVATYEGVTASLTIDSPKLRETEVDYGYTELYRVTSEYITDADGAWEKPPGWPDENTYPGGEEGPDSSSFQRLSRTHEIGHIDSRGRVSVRPFSAQIERPYGGDGSYRPVYSLMSSGTLPADVMTSIRNRYPGVA